MRFPLVRAALVLATATTYAAAQTTSTDTTDSGALNVFLDCQHHRCDFDFFRREIAGVNWMRDRTAADVHVIVVDQETGAGGDLITATFLGLGRFAGDADTLSFATRAVAVDDEVRRGVAQMLKVGLLRYVARSSGLEAVTISFDPGNADDDVESTADDPWNAWVFRTAVDGDADGDRTSTSLEGELELSANRVTPNWKTEISVEGSYDDSKFDLSDGTRFTNIQRNYSAEVLQVRSIGNHLSVGAIAGVGSSTFSNQKRVLKFAPAIEYDLFPYDESARRNVTFQYSAGVARYHYQDTTIFLRTQETVPVHSFRALVGAREAWGTLGFTGLFRTQLNDVNRRRAAVGGDVSVRLLRGLSLEASGDVSHIADQIYLPREEATDEEILVQQRERATSYRFSFSVGLSYTFGSLFNNIVNPRFGSIDFF
jgi:hypothetical protein